jgi:hypothetical protein
MLSYACCMYRCEQIYTHIAPLTVRVPSYTAVYSGVSYVFYISGIVNGRRRDNMMAATHRRYFL